ncbi:BZ3500_MvSof-1268-A1-R1_Chr1-3g01733 [Microbotryum saponariae]|uniref:BZ3500_MvSof-1268-A1-R1_Chr1-3g01733 protein n=1 Tax=Microbotryum saponariae TaxID=289078 RepID=A0A2X0MPW2_9BASI|nr:BZ3500_MvSof-1268-A1-R1_Chr1-3g01733 [Microbotryum saponariae]SCZ94464.1 BZ3501_MvSof-1269-A2-R1_Chr1-3g01335 [Microbotryum saponariae]
MRARSYEGYGNGTFVVPTTFRPSGGGPGPSLTMRSAWVACPERQIRFVACPRRMRSGQPRMDLLEGWISVSRI